MVVALVQACQAERDGQQAGADGIEVEPVGVGTAHDGGEPVERGQLQAEGIDQGVETAALAHVGDGRAGNIERHRTQGLRARQHLGRGCEVELGQRVDEAAHQPGTGDAVDAGAFARDPATRCFTAHAEIAPLAQHGQGFGAHAANEGAAIDPGLATVDAAFQRPGPAAGRAQLARRALAHLVAMHAVHDHFAVGIVWREGAQRTRHPMGTGVEAFGAAHIQDPGRASVAQARGQGCA